LRFGASGPGGIPEARNATTSQAKRRRVLEVAAALGLPLATLGAVAVAALAGALDLGVAHLRLAPTSSASSLVTERLSASGVSQLRRRIGR
jgi:hypothetical protein